MEWKFKFSLNKTNGLPPCQPTQNQTGFTPGKKGSGRVIDFKYFIEKAIDRQLKIVPMHKRLSYIKHLTLSLLKM